MNCINWERANNCCHGHPCPCNGLPCYGTLKIVSYNYYSVVTLLLFCSLAVLNPRVGHTTDVLSPFISVILTDSSTGSPANALMLFIQAVRGLPRLCAPGIVPCIISFYRQLPCFLVWPHYASFPALMVSNSYLLLQHIAAEGLQLRYIAHHLPIVKELVECKAFPLLSWGITHNCSLQ